MITALLHIQAKPFVAALPFLPMERFEAPDSDSSYSSSESESDSPLEGLLKLDDVEEEDPACKGGWLV